jgi:hypothetical protein
VQALGAKVYFWMALVWMQNVWSSAPLVATGAKLKMG